MVNCHIGGVLRGALRLLGAEKEESSIRDKFLSFNTIPILWHLSLSFGTPLASVTSVFDSSEVEVPMNRRLAIPLTLGFLLACGSGPVKAQDANTSGSRAVFPVIPMTVRFRTVPFYFRESLAEDSPYSSIEALVDNQQSEPWIEIVLTERATGNSVHYCNVQRSVASMTERGEEAYFAPIEFHSMQDASIKRVFTFQFADNAGESVEWRVVLVSASTGARSEAGIIPQPDRYGFVLASGMRSAAVTSGSVLRIRNANDASAPAEEPKNLPDTEILCATDMILAEIQPGTEIWNVDSSPADLQDRAQWVLRSSGGRKRLLTIEQASTDEIHIQQEDPEFPDSASVQLDLQRIDGDLALRSVTLVAQGHKFRITFEPGLSLPAPLTTDASDTNFSIDEDDHRNVASGRASVTRAVEAEHVTWRLDAPDWAKADTFETGVNILSFGSER
jgi:hypothetical protein